MTVPGVTVKFTANFEANLASIEAFWRERGAPQAYALLLEDLGKTVIGNLEQHPHFGRRFLSRSPQSIEARSRVASLQQRLDGVDLREYLTGDYLILYSLSAEIRNGGRPIILYLLAIRHHRQLSFDFEGFWTSTP
ncbi:MAG: type II toxin-antitoxin system RelE/ParE family toxin [Rhodoferax sp.]|nr:type II toxin-antitoxin system RelE/ParE family toxin [Rhodoferax sp.]